MAKFSILAVVSLCLIVALASCGKKDIGVDSSGHCTTKLRDRVNELANDDIDASAEMVKSTSRHAERDARTKVKDACDSFFSDYSSTLTCVDHVGATFDASHLKDSCKKNETSLYALPK